MPIIKIDDPVYRNKITFIYDEPDKKVIQYLKSRVDYNAEEIIAKSHGFFIDTANSYYIVIRDNCVNWLGTLVHECMHVASRTLRERGSTLCDESEEAYTYYIQWLFNACALPTVKKKIKSKKGK
jgi:hypothetical protein